VLDDTLKSKQEQQGQQLQLISHKLKGLLSSAAHPDVLLMAAAAFDFPQDHSIYETNHVAHRVAAPRVH
jgi:hypothetical protein